MSISTTRTYFKTHLQALGYEEWQDGFNFNNIPENILDKAFHIENMRAEKMQMGHTDVHLGIDVTTRVFFKGFSSVKEALDIVDTKIEEIIVEILKPSNRLSGVDGLRDVQIVGYDKTPIDTNDNSIIAEIRWKARVAIDYC